VTLGKHAPIQVTLQAVGQRFLGGAWGIRIIASCVVPDRDGGTPLDVQVWREINPACVTGAHVVEVALAMVREIYLHEMEENLLVGGRRIMDPHASGGR
jgi:hypothetical protein